LAKVRVVDALDRALAKGVCLPLNQTGKPARDEPKQHDLLGWYRLALQYGLADEPAVACNLDLLNQLHLTHYTRYPQDRTAPVPDASAIADTTVDHLIFVFTQAIFPR